MTNIAKHEYRNVLCLTETSHIDYNVSSQYNDKDVGSLKKFEILKFLIEASENPT